MENGVVMSLHPRGIVFVPNSLNNLDIDPNVEVIYSHALEGTIITSLSFPKSLKQIHSFAFSFSSLNSVIFEEGTNIESIGLKVFTKSEIENLSIQINGKMYRLSSGVIVLPSNYSHEHFLRISPQFGNIKKIICPRSSLLTLARQSDLIGETIIIQYD